MKGLLKLLTKSKGELASSPSWRVIEQADELESFLQAHRAAKVCFVDLEADNLHHYGERICLVQLLVGQEIVLIDPLAKGLEIDLFYQWLQGRQVWMHGADYDMRLFLGAGASLPNPLWDTQIAARLVGRTRFGLATLVEEEFAIKLAKSSQRADWSKRPLPEKMLEYAACDVHFLPELSERLVKELRKKKRYGWFEESCSHSREQGMSRGEEDEETIWRVSGSGKLSRRALGYLHALWHWREQSARSWDRPVFYLANNQKLIDWANQLERGESPNFERVRSRWRPALQEAIAQAKAINSEELPKKRLQRSGSRRDSDWEKQVERLRVWRNKRAKEVGLDAGVLASRSALEALVSKPHLAEELLMNWQRELLKISSEGEVEIS